jgi:alkanal monooxygenase alpha chain
MGGQERLQWLVLNREEGWGEKMDIGISMTTAQLPGVSAEAVFESATRQTEEAEKLGFTDAWVLEHHFTRYGLCSNPVTMASYLLGRTSSIKIGTAVTVLPLYHPVRLAEQIAMIDHLSAGRFLMGIGRGAFPKDFAVFGGTPSESHNEMRECLALILKAWTEDIVESTNGRHRFPAVPVYPQPRTKPYPPIYVVCESPATTSWVASQGYPMMLSWWIERERMRAQIELYNEVARAHGHDPTKVKHAIACIASVDDDKETAMAAIRDNFRWWRKVGADAHFKLEELRELPNYPDFLRRWEDFVLGAEGDSEEGWEEMDQGLLDLNVIGTPDECVEWFTEVAEITGVQHFVCGFDGRGDVERVIDNMRRFSVDVMPRICGPNLTRS